MLKTFAVVAVALGLTAAGAAVAGPRYYDPNQPAPVEASRTEARSQAAYDVIDGRLSLLEAAAKFRDLNEQTPNIADVLTDTYPADTEEERACLHVLGFVRAELQGRQAAETSTEPAADVLARLEAELKKARDKDGKVHLPGDAS